MEIFVPDYDWNSHWESVESNAAACELREGEEFSLVRITVGCCTTYRIIDGKPVPIAISFPKGIDVT